MDRRILVPLSMLGVISVGSAYAFLTSLSVTTTLHIGEPLSIVAIIGTGDLASISCSNNGPLTATCGLDLMAGAIGGITITVRNAGSQALVITPSGLSDDTDVALVVPDPATIPAGENSDFTFRVNISASAVPDSATLNLAFSR